jgi:hypothetical protein
MDRARRQDLIARYRAGARAVNEALDGVREAELDPHPIADEWSVREVVHHLADSEMTSALRLRRLLAEEQPTLQGYDEAEFARRLYYQDRPIQPSLDALAAARASTADILDRLAEADWSREGLHTESGRYTVEDWLQIYAAHAHDHAAQIQRVRAAMGR